MKRLAIIRHAKAEREGYDRDFTRILISSGIKDVKKVAGELKKREVIPDKIISSSATRAFTTAKLMAEVLGFPELKIEQRKDLYFEFTTKEFVDLVQDTSDDVETLFVVGHNPFMHFVAQNLSQNYDGHMPTCSSVILDFDVDSWKDVEARQGVLFLHLYPKLYK